MSGITDHGLSLPEHVSSNYLSEITVLTLNKLDAIAADRLHRKLGRAWRLSEESLARRRHRLMCRVYLYLHRALMRTTRSEA